MTEYLTILGAVLSVVCGSAAFLNSRNGWAALERHKKDDAERRIRLDARVRALEILNHKPLTKADIVSSLPAWAVYLSGDDTYVNKDAVIGVFGPVRVNAMLANYEIGENSWSNSKYFRVYVG
jgi:hypothetical protein